MVHISIGRSEAGNIRNNPGWSLVFGRRKVGKTYLIENYVPHDVYFYVRIDRSVSSNGYMMSEIGDLSTLKNAVVDLLERNRVVVIDEFQRLPMKTLEDISRLHPRGRLILTGSSMKVANMILGRNSPLLGLLRPFKIDIISPADLLRATSPILGPRNAIEYGPFLRDPWTIDFFRSKGFIRAIVDMLPHTVPGLIGEVFSEDERELTRVYTSILSLIGGGHTDYRELGNILYSRQLVGSPTSSSVLPYMKTMVDMGLLERNPIYKKSKYVYNISSFPVRAYYYLESRYGLNKAGFNFEEVRAALSNIHDLAIENLMSDLFSQLLNGQKTILKNQEREIDILITKRGSPILAGEVKWGRAKSNDVSKFLDKVSDLDCRKIFIARDGIETDEIEVLTPEGVIGLLDRKLKTGSNGRYEGNG